MAEYKEIKHVIDEVAKQKDSLQQEKERFQLEKEMLQQDQHANGEALAAMKEDLLASKNTLVEARDALVASTEEISQKNCYLEFLKKKLQESEARNNQTEQQCGSVKQLIQPGGVQTRSTQKRKRQSEGPVDYGDGDNEHASLLDGRSLSPLESLETSNVQTGSMKKQMILSEKPLGDDAVNLEVTEGCSRKELVNNPPAGHTSCVLVRKEDDLEAVRDELIMF